MTTKLDGTSQNQLLSQVSHDLCNYIGGISGLANIIADNLRAIKKGGKDIICDNDNDRNQKSFDEALELVNILIPFAKEASGYIDDILDSSQIQSGKYQGTTVKINFQNNLI